MCVCVNVYWYECVFRVFTSVCVCSFDRILFKACQIYNFMCMSNINFLQ